MDLRILQVQIKQLVAKINVKHNHPYPELISHMKLIEEIGEITELMLSNQIDSRKTKKQSKTDIKDKLGDEIADSMIALIALANDFDIDICKHISFKLTKHMMRETEQKN